MVHEAKDETAQSNKLLNEANGKIDVLEAEVHALKALVLTSTPSEPNKHLHPHLLLSSANAKNSQNFQHQASHSGSSNNLFLQQQFSTPNKGNLNAKSTTAHKRTPSYNDVAKNNILNFNHQEEALKVDENSTLKYGIYEVSC